MFIKNLKRVNLQGFRYLKNEKFDLENCFGFFLFLGLYFAM